MRVLYRRWTWLVVAWMAFLAPAGAQTSGGGAASVQSAVNSVQQQVRAGLRIHWHGNASVAGEMLSVTFENPTSTPMSILLVPGMVLEPSDTSQQRVILESRLDLSVAAGAQVQANLRGYCLDRELDPPRTGQDLNYQFAADANGYKTEIRIVQTGLRLSAENKLQTRLPAVQRRTIVIQRALWARPVGGTPLTREALNQDITSELQQSSEASRDPSRTVAAPSPSQLQDFASRILHDVEMILREASK